MPAEQNERLRNLPPDPLGERHGAVPLRREVALDAHQIGRKRLAVGDPALQPVDSEVDHPNLVPLRLQTSADRNQAERLDEGQHFKPENAAYRRLEKSDAHGSNLFSWV